MSVQKTYSLRRRWWSATFIIHLAFWMMAILVIIGTSWHIAERMVKESLFETGMLLMSARQDFQEPTPLQEDAPPPAGSPFAPDSSDIRISRYGIQYQMLLDSRIVHKSPRAPATAFATFPEDRSWIPPSPNRGRNLERRAKPDGSPRMRNHGLIRGFTRVSIDDRMWWVFIVKNPEDGFEVQVGRPLSPYVRFLTSIAAHLALPAFILFLIFAGVQVWVSRKLMAPLNQVTALVTQKSPRDLSPIQIEKLPGELSPLVGSINAMLPRLSRALEAEQRFTSDAAHELRTPLSALAMKAQLLKRQYPEVEPALLALTTDINRATSLIEQLLQLARLDPLNDDIHPITEEEIALADYVEGWLAPHREVARQKGISLTHTIPPDLLARVNPGLLGIALRNLIENALIYTEQGGKIEVSAGVKETGLTLTVADNGVGVPPEHYAQLANRFYRVLGTGKTGSGLGLSIVKRIAELHRGTLTFGEGLDGKGLSVTVTCAYLPQK